MYYKKHQHECGNSCKCENRKKLAHAYVPFQENTESFCGEEALKKGTLYKDLYQPYEKCRSKR